MSKSVEFLRALCGCEPVKCRPDYAKFELDDPPLVLSLEPNDVEPGGNLNHLGFRVATGEDLVEVQRRLELAGISTRREAGVECCYARQTKFWLHDPDGNLWEVYTLDEDLAHRGDGLPVIAAAESSSRDPVTTGSVWRHRLGSSLPDRLPVLDATVDHAVLQGTFNDRLDESRTTRLLSELHRVLKPAGKLHLHLLTASGELGDRELRLPGPAAAVRQVPRDESFLARLCAAGFANVRYVYRATSPCFTIDGIELRETRLELDRP